MARIGYAIGYDALQEQIFQLQQEQNMIQTAPTVSALPDPGSLPDGTLAAVLNASANGLPSILMVRSGLWVQPLEAFPPTITFVCQSGGGAGELPEDVVVASGASVAVGTGFVTVPAETFFRPANVHSGSINPAEIVMGSAGAGIWRIAIQLNYDSPAPASSVTTHFVLQRNTGGGYVDVPQGELIRLEQQSPLAVDSISQVGLHLNMTLAVGDKLRVIVKHDAGTSRTYVIRAYQWAMNQVAATPT